MEYCQWKNIIVIIQKNDTLEKFLEDNIIDYKFMCFNGKVENCFICLNRNTTGLNINFYDRNWNLLHLKDIDQTIRKYLKTRFI